MVKAYLLLIGSELLEFTREEKNGLFLTSKLQEYGVELCGYDVVADDVSIIEKSILKALSFSDIIITSGGLGATGDDLTREAIAKALKKPLLVDEKWEKVVSEKIIRRGRKPKEIEKKMALVVDGGEIIPNEYGLAGGVFFEADDKLIFALPGVPSEFQDMVENFVLSKISAKYPLSFRRCLKITLAGIGESDIQLIINEVLPKKDLKYSILPHYGVVELKISFYDPFPQEDVIKIMEKIDLKLKENIISFKGEKLEEVILNILKEKNFSLSVAESVTGGRIANKLVSVSGASLSFCGGIIAYSNEAKMDLLGVPKEEIENYGAVSEEVALSMARGARAKFLSPCAIATTGIAGPTGATDKKPLGLVYIAVSKPKKEEVYKYVFPYKRNDVIEMTSNYALFHFLKLIR